jgi:hypothetical protein
MASPIQLPFKLDILSGWSPFYTRQKLNCHGHILSIFIFFCIFHCYHISFFVTAHHSIYSFSILTDPYVHLHFSSVVGGVGLGWWVG